MCGIDATAFPASSADLRAALEQNALLVPETDAEGWYDCEFRALGSQCSLFFEAQSPQGAEKFRRSALAWLAGFEARFSRYREDSTLCRLNALSGTGEWLRADPDMNALLGLCEEWNFQTQGAFDATTLPLSRLWDWKARHDTLPTEAEIREAASLTGWQHVQRSGDQVRLARRGMEIDFGGVGKEYAADVLRVLGRNAGLSSLMVSLGGDISVFGEPPEGGSWYVGLEHPEAPEKCHCGIRLRDGSAVATSGDYRRCFVHNGIRYGHIIDSRTGRPVANGTHAVSVIAPLCTRAGLAATTAMILGGMAGIAELDRQHGVEGCLWKDGRLIETRGFRRCILPDGWDDED